MHNKLTLFQNTNSIINHYIAELRDVNIQQDRVRFRRNLERIGEAIAYEISKTLKYEKAEVTTPLGISETSLLNSQPVVATILRAGLPLHQGIMNVFDKADAAFIAAYRKEAKKSELTIQMDYVAAPAADGRVLILADPMLATGMSMVMAVKQLMDRSEYSEIHIVSVIASSIGLAYVQRNLPKAHIWLAALDEELTTKSYIVPGLGDAGDLCFGEKE